MTSSLLATDHHLVLNSLSSYATPTAVAFGAALFGLVCVIKWVLQRPPADVCAPKFYSDGYDLFAAWRFFSSRWDYYQEGTAKRTRNFSFWIGKYPLVGLTGAAARKTFYEHKALSVNEGHVQKI